MTDQTTDAAFAPLRCQQTLELLTVEDDALVATAGELRYAIDGGLVYMGHPADDAEVQEAMEEERVWQGTVETAERDLEFLRLSAPEAVTLVNSIARWRKEGDGNRALDLGSGAGWVAWLLAEAGYDTWMCDFEANSLSLGLVYQHPNLGLGKRIVADGRYAPFADASFDVLLCKEFAHHIDDKGPLFAEINRVLKPGGLLALSEPVMSISKWLRERRHPDPHESHRISWPHEYTRALRAQGFEVLQRGYSYGDTERRRLTAPIKRRTNRDVEQGRPKPALSTSALVYASGGTGVVAIARKQREAARIPRPAIRPIPPAQTQVGADDRRAFEPLADALRDAGRALKRI